MRPYLSVFVAALSLFALMAARTNAADASFQVGVAKVDITPTYPIRLCGYAARKTESEGVEQHLFAKAIAIGEGGNVAVLVTVDNTAVPAAVIDEVAHRLESKAHLARERLVVCSSHT